MSITKAHTFREIKNNGGAARNMGGGSQAIRNVIKDNHKIYKASAHVSKISLDKSAINKPIIRKTKNSIPSIFSGGSEHILRRSVNSVIIDLAGTRDLLLIDSPYKRTADVPFPGDEVNTQGFAIQADGCENPGQRQNVVLIGPKTGNVRPSSWFRSNIVDFAPGCGCYTDLTYGLLDVIPIGILIDGIWGSAGRVKALKKIREILFDTDMRWLAATSYNRSKDAAGNVIKGHIKKNIDKAKNYLGYLDNINNDPKFFKKWAVGAIDAPDQIEAFLAKQGETPFANTPNVLIDFQDMGLDSSVAREITTGATMDDFALGRFAKPPHVIVNGKRLRVINYDYQTINDYLDSPVSLVKDRMNQIQSVTNFGGLVKKDITQGNLRRVTHDRVNYYGHTIEGWAPGELSNFFEEALKIKLSLTRASNPNLKYDATISVSDLIFNNELTDAMVSDKLWLDTFYAHVGVNLTAAMDNYNFAAGMNGNTPFTGADLTYSMNVIKNLIDNGTITAYYKNQIRRANQRYVDELKDLVNREVPRIKAQWDYHYPRAKQGLQILDILSSAADKSQDSLEQDIIAQASHELTQAGITIAKEALVWFTPLVTYLGLAAFGLVRQKYCGGFLNMVSAISGGLTGSYFYDDTILNPATCNCDCQQGFDKCPADPSSESWFSTPAWTFAAWNNVIPAVPKTDELGSCYRKCCDSQTGYTNPVTFLCGCACFGDITVGTPIGGGDPDSTFRAGAGCDCFKPTLFGLQKGICINPFEETRRTALGEVWDANKCEFICPNTGKPGAGCNGYATPVEVTYVDGNGASQTENSLCDCECIDPQDGSQWPPDCAPGEEFNADPNVCGCQPCTGNQTWDMAAFSNSVLDCSMCPSPYWYCDCDACDNDPDNPHGPEGINFIFCDGYSVNVPGGSPYFVDPETFGQSAAGNNPLFTDVSFGFSGCEPASPPQ